MSTAALGPALLLSAACSPAPDRFTPTWAACSDGRDGACDAALIADFGALDTTESLLDGLWELLRVASELNQPQASSEYAHCPLQRWVCSPPDEKDH